MKAVRVFASVGVLSVASIALSDGAFADRDGPFVYYGSRSSSSQPAISRSGDGFFSSLFGRRKRPKFDPALFDPQNGRYREPAFREPAEIEAPEPVEKVVVYQPEKMVPLAVSAFTEPAPAEPLAQAIYTELLDSATPVRVTAAEKTALLAFYRGNGFKPLWATADGLSPRARDALAYLAASAGDGMEPEDYLPPGLAAFSDEQGMAGDLPHQARIDLGLSAAVLRYARHASGGRLIPARLTAYNDIAPAPVDLDRALKILARSPFPVAYLESLQPVHPAYAAFKTALAEKRKQFGDSGENSENDVVATGNRVRPGQTDDRLPLVRKRLQRLGYLETKGNLGDGAPAFGSAMTEADVGSPEDTLDPDLAKALKSFQKDVDIKATGSLDAPTVAALNNRSEKRDIDRLVYNMERLRWLPKDLGQRHVLVNQAAFELRVMEHGEEAWRTKVIVGKPNTQTFAFHDEIEMVVFNPSWGVPQSIIKNEMLPLLRKDPSYLDRLGYRVIGKNGKIIHSSAVDWWSVGGKVIPYSVQQPPSDDNALGEIKFLFPNKHDIYMHDTPTKPLFEKPVRAYSHGCVRVENPRHFGEVLLGWSADEIAERIDSGRSETVKLPHKIPVHLTYFTAWPEKDGRIVFYDDIYGRDQRMERALNATEVASR